MVIRDDTAALAALRALSDPTRLEIVKLLSQSCCARAALRETGEIEGPTAGEVCCRLPGVPKANSTISHHLKELESAGLISMTRRGKAIVCSLQQQALLDLAARLADLAQAKDPYGSSEVICS